MRDTQTRTRELNTHSIPLHSFICLPTALHAERDAHVCPQSLTISHTTTRSVRAQILEEKPDGAVDLLETSLLVKRTAFVSPDVALAAASHIPPKVVSEAMLTAELFVAPEPPIDPETGTAMESEPPNEYESDDLLAAAPLFEAVGAGLGKAETVMVALAIKQLGEDPKLKLETVRFFGKVLGTEGDYYVFETTLKSPEPVEEEAKAPEFGRPASGIPAEESGTGCNKNVYFVCSFLGGAFTKLPDATPLSVTTAKSIKKFFTGKLDAEVCAYPPFPGTEKDFLRAQIAIIASETLLCPVGLYEGEEGSIDVSKVEDFAAPVYSEVSSWCHLGAALNSQGRCTWYEAPPVEGEEEKEAEEPEPVSVLSPATEDAEIDGTPAWTVVSSSCIPGLKHVTCAMRSNKFPGAIAVAKGGEFANLYVGYGVSSAALSPPFPPGVATEAEEVGESDEAPEPPPAPEPEEEPTEE